MSLGRPILSRWYHYGYFLSWKVSHSREAYFVWHPRQECAYSRRQSTCVCVSLVRHTCAVMDSSAMDWNTFFHFHRPIYDSSGNKHFSLLAFVDFSRSFSGANHAFSLGFSFRLLLLLSRVGLLLDIYTCLHSWLYIVDCNKCCELAVAECVARCVAVLQGFLLHVTQEHNMWSYMHFMLHLSNTNPSDYTALELYVHRLVTA